MIPKISSKPFPGNSPVSGEPESATSSLTGRSHIIPSNRNQPVSHPMNIRPLLFCSAVGALLTGATLLAPATADAQAVTFDVNVHLPQFNLYTDPYNGNQIKLGGFSGIYPVPGKPDSFYIVTDRGPAPDFTAADGTFYKAFAI